jgi:hypothetical protein
MDRDRSHHTTTTTTSGVGLGTSCATSINNQLDCNRNKRNASVNQTKRPVNHIHVRLLFLEASRNAVAIDHTCTFYAHRFCQSAQPLIVFPFGQAFLFNLRLNLQSFTVHMDRADALTARVSQEEKQNRQYFDIV